MVIFYNSLVVSCTDLIEENRGTADPTIAANIDLAEKVLSFLGSEIESVANRENNLTY